MFDDVTIEACDCIVFTSFHSQWATLLLVLIRFISPAQYTRTCVVESIVGQHFSIVNISFISIYSRGKILSPFFKQCSLLFLKSVLVYSWRICFNFYIDKIKQWQCLATYLVGIIDKYKHHYLSFLSSPRIALE